MCQTGCATSSKTFTPDPVVIELRPPDALLLPCSKPEPGDIETNGDLIHLLINTVEALDRCAAKVDAIRKYYGGK